MVERPWVKPEDVIEYSDIPQVKTRAKAKLEIDISRAEQYVVTYTNNNFKKAEAIPSSIKTAVILLAEAYAYNAYITTKEKKSETFDDYSYTTENNAIDIDALDIKTMLDEFVIVKARNAVTMRMRRL